MLDSQKINSFERLKNEEYLSLKKPCVFDFKNCSDKCYRCEAMVKESFSSWTSYEASAAEKGVEESQAKVSLLALRRSS